MKVINQSVDVMQSNLILLSFDPAKDYLILIIFTYFYYQELLYRTKPSDTRE